MYSAACAGSILSFVSHLVCAGDADNHCRPPSKGGFEGIKKVLATVGLGCASQPQLACRGMLSQDLFESPSLKDGQSCGSSQANRHGLVTPLPSPKAHLGEMMMMIKGGKAPLKNLLYSFPGLVLREQQARTGDPILTITWLARSG
jgi:hypothetical protein